MTTQHAARQEGTLRSVDRWAGSDGEYDRWAGSGRDYDRWAGSDREYDRLAATDRDYDRWAATDRDYDRLAGSDGDYDRWAATDRDHDRWAEADGEYDGHGRLTARSRRPLTRWVVLLLAWVVVAGLLLAVHLTILIWVIMVGLIGYVAYCILRDTPRAARRPRRRATTAVTADDGRERFNAPPGWPEPPPGWTPSPGWQPDAAWPPAPPGWQFWLPPARQGVGERPVRARRHRGEPDDDRFTDGWR